MPKQKNSLDKIEEAIDLYSHGLTIGDVAKAIHLSRPTVLNYLKKAGVDTAGRNHPSFLLLRKITNGDTIAEAEEKIGLPRSLLPTYLYRHCYRSKTIASRLGPKLRAAYPDKQPEINELMDYFRSLDCMSAADLKKTKKKNDIQEDPRKKAAELLCTWREACGVSLAEVRPLVKIKVVQDNLGRIEAGDPTLALSVYRDAVTTLGSIYRGYPSSRQGNYEALLVLAAQKLKRDSRMP